ncbi:MAG: hypothetical protein FJ109_09980 [Deltaproteobacteria bacterium]|nr:hypothetical protein [Deltaproteobacteria bacterium]
MNQRRIWLADHRGRNAVVALVARRRDGGVQYADAQGAPARFCRVVKGTEATAWERLRTEHSDPELIARALLAGDPEADVETVGRAVGPCDRVFVDGQGKPLYSARPVDVLYDADGRETDRSEPVETPANLVPETPPVWSGRLLSRDEAVRRYAFTRAWQVRHTNALEHDFLHGLAEYLEQQNRLALVGSGPRGTGPLITERNATPMKGFLEGRTRGDRYLLVLHLAAFELRPPQEAS